MMNRPRRCAQCGIVLYNPCDGADPCPPHCYERQLTAQYRTEYPWTEMGWRSDIGFYERKVYPDGP